MISKRSFLKRCGLLVLASVLAPSVVTSTVGRLEIIEPEPEWLQVCLEFPHGSFASYSYKGPMPVPMVICGNILSGSVYSGGEKIMDWDEERWVEV